MSAGGTGLVLLPLQLLGAARPRQSPSLVPAAGNGSWAPAQGRCEAQEPSSSRLCGLAPRPAWPPGPGLPGDVAVLPRSRGVGAAATAPGATCAWGLCEGGGCCREPGTAPAGAEPVSAPSMGAMCPVSHGHPSLSLGLLLQGWMQPQRGLGSGGHWESPTLAAGSWEGAEGRAAAPTSSQPGAGEGSRTALITLCPHRGTARHGTAPQGSAATYRARGTPGHQEGQGPCGGADGTGGALGVRQELAAPVAGRDGSRECQDV